MSDNNKNEVKNNNQKDDDHDRPMRANSSDDVLIYNTIIQKGFLSKKRKIGFHKRYFILTPITLSYYNGPHDPFPSGYVSLREIDKLIYNPEKKGGRTFSLELCYDKIIQLVAESRETAIEWVCNLEKMLLAIHRRDSSNEPNKLDRHPHNNINNNNNNIDDKFDLTEFKNTYKPDYYSKTEFRLQFYKVAREDSDFLKLLMTKFRSEESMMYILIQVLISRDQTLLDGSRKTKKELVSEPLSARQQRSSGCSRYNPLIHSNSLTYNRKTRIDIDFIPNMSSRARRPSISPGSRSPSISQGSRTPSPLPSPPPSPPVLIPSRSTTLPSFTPSPSRFGTLRKRASRRVPSIAYSLFLPDSIAFKSTINENSTLTTTTPLPSIPSSASMRHPTMVLNEHTSNKKCHSRRASESEFALQYLDLQDNNVVKQRRRSRRTSSNYEVIVDLKDRFHGSVNNEESLSLDNFNLLTDDNKQCLYDWLISDEFLEAVCHVFTSSEWIAQRLALRIIWILLQRHNHLMLEELTEKSNEEDDKFPDECPECHKSSKEFVKFIEKILTGYISSMSLNHEVNNLVNGLLYILMTDVSDFCNDINQKHRGNNFIMGRDVRNYGVWEVIFRCLAHSEFHTRKRALKDINITLINRKDNCESLMSIARWQQFVLPLLVDIPKNLDNNLLEKTYHYTINIFTLLHYHSFLYYTNSYMAFQSVMRASLLSVLDVGDKQIHLMRSIFNSLMKKIMFHHRHRSLFDVVFDGCIWRNLKHLLKFVSAFVFLTPPRDVNAGETDLYINETRYGVHLKEDIDSDMGLIEVALELVNAIRLSKLEEMDSSVLDSTKIDDEHDAFISIKKSQYDQFFNDAMVFLPILHSLELTDNEIAEVVRDFLLAGGGHARKKIFKDAKGRHGIELKKQQAEERERSKTLDKQLIKDQQNVDMVFNLLLLGTGESGKSTIFKQIINIYGSGFTIQERCDYKPVIFENVVSSMYILCQQSELLGHTITDKEAADSRDFMLSLEAPFTLNEEIAKHIKKLWLNSEINTTYDERSKYQLPCGDSAAYFFDSLGRLLMRDYEPSFNDVLRCRLRTKGIQESRFDIDGFKFRVLDPGGQRSERKKWIHYFEHVTSLIFVAAINEYDQQLAEDESVNRLEESLNLFEDINHNRFFKSKDVILFLNKSDLFRKKLKHVPLSKYFPNYSGKSSKSAFKFMEELFLSRIKVKKNIFVHITCATDSNLVRQIFNDVQTTIITQSLTESGLY